MKRVFLIVLDSCGVGYEPDAAEFGDVGANTLHTCSQSPKSAMPNLISMGLGNLDGVDYLPKTDRPQAALATYLICSVRRRSHPKKREQLHIPYSGYQKVRRPVGLSF